MRVLILGACMLSAGCQSSPQSLGQGRAPATCPTEAPSTTSAVRGEATVRCQVRRDGTPHSCRVVSESPAGQGFGEAAVAVVEGAELRLPEGGIPADARRPTLTMTVPFCPALDPAPPRA